MGLGGIRTAGWDEEGKAQDQNPEGNCESSGGSLTGSQGPGLEEPWELQSPVFPLSIPAIILSSIG